MYCKTSSWPQSLPCGLNAYLEVNIPMLLITCDGGMTFESVFESDKPVSQKGERKDDIDKKERWCLENLPGRNSEFPLLRRGNTLLGFFRQPRVGVFFLQIKD